ncbi:hypothetical protein CW746_03600 [Staphylococcus succinus]|uniref:Mid2-like cell wall stress sensor domain protein n=1 Tax=Staphylococcus succinus TaxID=61015 RepID=A0ABX5IJG3_9STAP
MQYLYAFLFVLVFIPACTYYQLSVGRFQKKRSGKSDAELKIDKKHLIIGACFYALLSILVVIIYLDT